MSTREELREQVVKVIAELTKLEIMEPESEKTLDRTFEILGLLDSDRVKQAMMLSRSMHVPANDIAKWMLKKVKPDLSERKRIIVGVRQLIETRLLS